MNPNAIESLKVIRDNALQAKKENDTTVWLPSVELPVNSSEERDAVCKELEQNGCISDVEYQGKRYIGCMVHLEAVEKCLQQES